MARIKSVGPVDPRENMMAFAVIYKRISEETLLRLVEKGSANEA